MCVYRVSGAQVVIFGRISCGKPIASNSSLDSSHFWAWVAAGRFAGPTPRALGQKTPLRMGSTGYWDTLFDSTWDLSTPFRIGSTGYRNPLWYYLKSKKPIQNRLNRVSGPPLVVPEVRKPNSEWAQPGIWPRSGSA